MSEKRWLILILALFVMLGIIYSVVTPVFEASDELWHYPMIRHLADGNSLPVQVFDPAQAGPWRQEASQPPLYYVLGAALTFWIDTSDMAQVRFENPHVDNGLITEDGNANLVVHNPSWNQWQGTLLAVHIVRLFSVLLSTITLYLTYLIAKLVVPGRPEIALGATAVTAFLPMFLFISGAVNNDNLAIMLASLALYLMNRLIVNPGLATGRFGLWGYWLLLGSVIGLALLTKEGTFGLLPLAWGTGFVVAWQQSQVVTDEVNNLSIIRLLLQLLGKSLLYLAVMMLPAVLIAGWWYYRNLVLYGDWLGWSAFIAVLGQRAHPASLAQLWGERRGFLMAYWGLFGGVNVPMPVWIYRIFNSLLVISLFGFAIYFLRDLRNWLRALPSQKLSVRSLLDTLLTYVSSRFGLVVCLLFAGAVIYGLVQWATTTWSSQGRLIFTAMSALSILFVIGLVGWLPRRVASWTIGGIAAFMFIVAALAPFLWIRPVYDVAAYALPQTYSFHLVDDVFGDVLHLRSVAVETVVSDQTQNSLQPGDEVWVHLEWEVLQQPTQNWSVFVHVNDPVLGQPIAQRDMYLGQGLLLSSWLEPGQRLTNSYKLTLPQTAVAPAELELAVGIYDFHSGVRLPLSNGTDAAQIAQLSLQAVDGATPNPISVNFADEVKLIGYELKPRRTKAGETIELTLYWQGQRPLDKDYTFFAQVVDEDTTRWASHDLAPSSATSTWQPGELQRLQFSLPLREDTPPGLYPVIVGLYTQTAAGDFDRLQIVTSDGRLTDDFLRLTPVRID